MPRPLYKCSEFKEECYMENDCVIKNTFNPCHIWKRSRWVSEVTRYGNNFHVTCSKDKKIKEVRPCQ
jgi:hypothetical protein